MKRYHVVLALAVACVIFCLSSPASDPVLRDGLGPKPMRGMETAAISPFDTALVWSNNTGAQVNDIAVAEFDTDGYDETAVITQNGTLYMFEQDGVKAWQMDLGATAYSLAAVSVDLTTPQEILIGTSNGILLVAANQSMLLNQTIPDDVRIVRGADLDGDSLHEIVAGSEDSHIYAYDITGGQLWNYTSNSGVRQLDVADYDQDSQDEILAASQLRRLSLLDDNGSMILEKNLPNAITAIDSGDLIDSADLEAVCVDSEGLIRAYLTNGSLAFSQDIGD
ncbi:hypothetical protein EU538_05355, partial [Candidatus Thorarchaeota archaeon]